MANLTVRVPYKGVRKGTLSTRLSQKLFMKTLVAVQETALKTVLEAIAGTGEPYELQ
ncbi:MAG: hypothetical protein ACI93R_002224 [Flavobacteriales bacterium]